MDAAGVGPWRVRCDPTRGQSAKPVPPERHQISGQLIFRGGGQAEGLAGDRRSAIDSARQPLPAVIGAISECESHPDAHALERNRSRSNASRSLCRSRLRLAQPYRITHRRHYFNCVLCQSLPQRPRKPAAYGEVASPVGGEHSWVAHRRHGERSRSDGAATTNSFTDEVEHFVAAEVSSNDGNGQELARAAS